MEEAATQTPLVTYATIALSSGVIAASLGQWIQSYRESRGRKRDSTYLAIRVAVVLEKFAADCAHNISAFQADKKSGGRVGFESDSLPDLPPYPDNLSWPLVDPELCERVFSFRNELILLERNLATMSEIEPGAVTQLCYEYAGKVGRQAWYLAKSLRKHHGVRPLELGSASMHFVDDLVGEQNDSTEKTDSKQ